MDITRELAERVVAARFEDIPPPAAEAARRVLLDGIAVMLAGTRDPAGVGRRVAEYVRSQGGKAEAGVAGAGFRTTASLAAFANGTLAHALDFDDTADPVNHPGSSALPAALALAEREGKGGRELIAAVVLAYEVQGRLRLAAGEVPSGEGFHKPGVFGLMGAVAAAGKLLPLDAPSLCRAFGMAGSRAGSLAANTGTMTKPTHAGHAARMGVECAELASLGWTAHPDIFGAGRYGESFFPGRPDMDLLLKDFGSPYLLVDPGVGMKLYPCNYWTHRAIEGALRLRAEGVRAEDVERLEIRFPPLRYVDRPEPRTGVEGMFSVQYVAAAALLEGRVEPETFAEERLREPRVKELLRRIRLLPDPSIPADLGRMHCDLTAQMRDGTRRQVRVERLRGLWTSPLTEEELLEKFRRCAAGVLSEGTGEEVVRLVGRLAEGGEVRPLMAKVCRVAG